VVEHDGGFQYMNAKKRSQQEVDRKNDFQCMEILAKHIDKYGNNQ
jgi:hypothetical protein